MRRCAGAIRLDLVVGGKEGEGAAPKHVIAGVVLHPPISQGKEQRQRQLGRRHPRHFARRELRQAEAKDAVHALEIRTVAHGDSTKLGKGEVIAKLHDCASKSALENALEIVQDRDTDRHLLRSP